MVDLGYTLDNGTVPGVLCFQRQTQKEQKAMRESLGYYSAGHTIRVFEDCDWGGPCDYIPSCNCGWVGQRLSDVAGIKGDLIIGTRYEAFKEALDHLGITVVEYIERSEDEISRYLENIVKTVGEVNKIRSTQEAMRDLV